MKILLFLFSCFLFFCGCEEEDNSSVEPDKANFLKLEDRIGTWINHEKNDTLVFQNDLSVIRKYGSEVQQTYQYKIEDSTLYLDSTAHEISNVYIEEGKVKLHNMYIVPFCATCPSANGIFEKETE